MLTAAHAALLFVPFAAFAEEERSPDDALRRALDQDRRPVYCRQTDRNLDAPLALDSQDGPICRRLDLNLRRDPAASPDSVGWPPPQARAKPAARSDGLKGFRLSRDFDLYARDNPAFFNLWSRIAAGTRLEFNPGGRYVLSLSLGFERFDQSTERASEERYLSVLANLGNQLAAAQRDRLIRTWVVGALGLRTRLSGNWTLSVRAVVGFPFQGAWLAGGAADLTPP